MYNISTIIPRELWQLTYYHYCDTITQFCISRSSKLWITLGCNVTIDNTIMCTLAAKYGYLTVLQWLVKNGFSWSVTTCASAAENNHLEVLRWLRQHPVSPEERDRCKPCPWDATTCEAAARGGHLYLLKWARKAGCDWNESACIAAARGGHLLVLQWLLGATPQQQKEKMYRCISRRTISDRNNCPLSGQVPLAAAEGGHLIILKWLVEAKYRLNYYNCSYTAAEYGQLHILKWLSSYQIREGRYWDTDICRVAASNGHLEVLQWLIEQSNSITWDSSICLAASKNGHLTVLRYLIQVGCPYDSLECSQFATIGGHYHISEWLTMNGE